MTKLNPTNLFAVEVPIYAEKIKISGLNWLCVSIKGHWTAWEELHNNFEILGEVAKDEISFYGYIPGIKDKIRHPVFVGLLQSNELEFKEGFKYVILKPL